MTTSHTPGTIALDIDELSIKAGGTSIAVLFLPEDSNDGCRTAWANGRRLVACWNALVGIPTDKIEQVVNEEIVQPTWQDLKDQRDELLEVLKGLLSGMFDGPDESDAAALVAKARAAIAKAEGKA